MNKKVKHELSQKAMNHKTSKQFHQTENWIHAQEQVVTNAPIKVWWTDETGREWHATIKQ